MAVFNRTFRSNAGAWFARFLGGPSGEAGPSIPMQALALDIDTPVGPEHPLPTADAELKAAVLSLVSQQTVTPAGARIVLEGDDPQTIVAATSTGRAVEIYNVGPGAGTFVVDGDATGADTERRLEPGERRMLCGGKYFVEKVSFFPLSDTVIETETWS